MAKFNVVQKQRKAQVAERKRSGKGDPSTGKLSTKPQTLSCSGKRKQKLLKKWRRDQKEAVDKGLITMQDVEMAIAEGDGPLPESSAAAPSVGFAMKLKKKKALKLKQLMKKGKGKKGKNQMSNPSPAQAVAALDSMVE